MRILTLVLWSFLSTVWGQDASIASEIAALRREVTAFKENANKEIALLKNTLDAVTRQVMMMQLFVEERIRSDGHSGVKRVRHRTEGTQPFHAESHTGNSVASLHDHANLVNTAGMGEFAAVLNGVEFRTRHNDYKLVMPSRSQHGGTKGTKSTKSGFHQTEPIPFPQVPPAVLKKAGNMTAQVLEMREWFKAWRDGDHKVRDYRPFFRPVLCYLEGAWMADTDKLEESFESDRHQLDASSWFDLQEKVRFTSYSGRKSNLENYAYLPTTIIGTLKRQNVSLPILAQWNYRILCHPLKVDLPLAMVRAVDDFSNRMAYFRKFENIHNSRATRYQINPFNRTYFREGRTKFGVMDTLMMEIPGKDNYPGEAVDNAFGLPAMHLKKDEPVNAAYYNRIYRVTAKGAMGLSSRHRGFSDENLFAALTNSTKVAPMNVTDCIGRGKNRKCTTYTQRWTWAFPLELIYLTPLQRWNPYNLTFHGYSKDDQKKVIEGGRNGGFTNQTAYNGMAQKYFFQTPLELFDDAKDSDKDKADTGSGAQGVLDPNGQVRKVLSSGIKTVLPSMPGLGRMRVRFPIAPLHEEGGTAFKEVVALRELVMEPRSYANMMRHSTANATGGTELIRLRLGSQGTHFHDVLLTPEEVADMHQGRVIDAVSEEENGHSHFLKLVYNVFGKYIFKKCDGKTKRCPDGHHAILIEVKNE